MRLAVRENFALFPSASPTYGTIEISDGPAPMKSPLARLIAPPTISVTGDGSTTPSASTVVWVNSHAICELRLSSSPSDCLTLPVFSRFNAVPIAILLSLPSIRGTTPRNHIFRWLRPKPLRTHFRISNQSADRSARFRRSAPCEFPAVRQNSARPRT